MSRDYRFWVDVALDGMQDVAGVAAVVEEFLPDSTQQAVVDRDGVCRLLMQGDGTLSGGLSFKVFAVTVQRRIWAHLRRYVPVVVQGVRLEPNEADVGVLRDFEAARDAGLLNRRCAECDGELGFAVEGDHCEPCCVLIAMEAQAHG